MSVDFPALNRRLEGATASFTPFVPALTRLPLTHHRRWMVSWGSPLVSFVARVLERAEVPAHAVRARQLACGQIVLLTRMPEGFDPEFKPGSVQPVAFIHAGPTASEVEAALAHLAGRQNIREGPRAA